MTRTTTAPSESLNEIELTRSPDEPEQEEDPIALVQSTDSGEISSLDLHPQNSYDEDDEVEPLMVSEAKDNFYTDAASPRPPRKRQNHLQFSIPIAIIPWAVLGVVLFGVLFYEYVSHSSDSLNDGPQLKAGALIKEDIFWTQSNDLDCAKMDLNISFDVLYEQALGMTGESACADIPPQHRRSLIAPAVPGAGCRCSDQPLGASRGMYGDGWERSFQLNQELANNATQADGHDVYDIVLYGDSITEHWRSVHFGQENPAFQDNLEWYHTYFHADGRHQESSGSGSMIDGLALGISGDMIPNLLYRIRSGELPDALRMRVLWILIGINDLGVGCKREVVLAGILQLVLELQQQRPQAAIVINGLLPRSLSKDHLLFRKDGRDGSILDLDPLYEDIAWINQRVECFVSAYPPSTLSYFDPLPYFTIEKETVSGGVYWNDEVLPDSVHPNGKGSELWGRAIVDRVKHIIER